MSGILVCGPVSYFADDVHVACANCGADVVHRPHMPPDLVKMCMECALYQVAEDPQPPRVVITEETHREVALWQATTKGRH